MGYLWDDVPTTDSGFCDLLTAVRRVLITLADLSPPDEF